jgi:hypothetical protein
VTMYDIYLFTGMRPLPVLANPAAIFPMFAQADMERFQERVRQKEPGFLLLDLDVRDIVKVFQWVRRGKAQGYILPAAYRHPRILQEEARSFAEAELAKLQMTQDSAQPTVSLQFTREEPVCWTFKDLNNRKVRLHVDKLDGHLWPRSDLRRVWNMYYFLGESAKGLRDPYIVPASSDNPDRTYDIHLAHGAEKLPVLNDLISNAPVLQELTLHHLLMQQNMSLLPVALSKEQALDLLYRLEKEGAWGCLLSAAYRHPQITKEQAASLAQREVTEHLAIQRPGDTLGSVKFFREMPCCWVYGVSSAQLAKEERTPDMIFINIDKLDGHIWSLEELERFSEEN